MPALETLSIRAILDVHDGDPADIPISHNLFPCLTTLDLYACAAPLDTPVYTSLGSLKLMSCRWAISYGDFLGLMSNCHTLQYLCLDQGVLDLLIDQIVNSTTGYPPLTTPVVLPRLETLKLCGHPNVLFHLLATIHAPQATRIKLMTCHHRGDPSLLIPRVLAPNPQLRYPFLSMPRTVSFSCFENSFKLSIQGGFRGDALFFVDYGAVLCYNTRAPRGSIKLEPNLVTFMDTFPPASLIILQIEDRPDEIAVKTWQRVFQTFSNLRRLRLKGTGTLDAVWAGLSRATASSLEDHGTLCCPHLCEVVIEGRPGSAYSFSATPTLFDAIRAVLRSRADAGAVRLRKFKLYFEYTDELWVQTYPDGNAVVPEDVRAMVGELECLLWRAQDHARL